MSEKHDTELGGTVLGSQAADLMASTAAGLRCLREEAGLTVNDLADMVGAGYRTVLGWEDPGRPWYPASDVVEAIQDVLDRQAAAVRAALEIAEKTREANGGDGPDAVVITCYRTQKQYDEHGREPGPFGVANANARACARALVSRGYRVEMRYPDEGAISTPGSRY